MGTAAVAYIALHASRLPWFLGGAATAATGAGYCYGTVKYRVLIPFIIITLKVTFLNGAHLGLLVCEARTHDVRPTEDELDGPLVHSHPRQHEGVWGQINN